VTRGRRRFSHVVGFDDAPFERSHRGDVPVVGTVYAGERLEGVMVTRVRRDGRNATDALRRALDSTRFRAHLHLVLLQGITLAGFNVVDIHRLAEASGLPVLVVARRRPDLARIRAALLHHVPGGHEKWRLVERAGPMEPVAHLYVQRAGLTLEEARLALGGAAATGRLPDALRTAHLVAGALTRGESRHRA